MKWAGMLSSSHGISHCVSWDWYKYQCQLAVCRWNHVWTCREDLGLSQSGMILRIKQNKHSQEEEAYAKARALSLDSFLWVCCWQNTVQWSIHQTHSFAGIPASPLEVFSSLSLPFVFCMAPAPLGASIVLDGQTGDGEKGEPCSSQACLGLLDAQRTQVEKGHSLLKGAPQGWSLLASSQFPFINKSKWWRCVKFSL